jgi:outer membrane protein OmpA-like peptidoglycan-associated protein
VAVVAVGCATPRYDAHGNLYYEHHSHRRATQGAVLGGLAGAGIGAAVADRHHDEAGFWIGGALGALTGAAIGDAIDRDEAARHRAHRHDRRFDRRRDHRHRGPERRHRRGPDRHHDDDWDDGWYRGSDAREWADPDPEPLVLSVPGEVIFEPGSAALSPGAERRLREVAHALRRHPEAVAVVRGHTDGSHGETRRPDLSEVRAEAVRAHLLHHGVAPSRVTALGMGARFPVARNDTAAGRQRNRRVEIEIRAERGHDLAGLW